MIVIVVLVLLALSVRIGPQALRGPFTHAAEPAAQVPAAPQTPQVPPPDGLAPALLRFEVPEEQHETNGEQAPCLVVGVKKRADVQS